MERASPFFASFFTGVEPVPPLERQTRVEALLADALKDARARYPRVALEDDAFITFVAARVDEAELPNAALGDLFLACACLAGDSAALSAFEAQVMSGAPKAAARIDGAASFVADVVADVRIKLLVGAGKGAGLLRYRGRGPLRSFAMVVAMREAVDRVRAQSARREVDITDLAELLSDAPLGLDLRLRGQVHGAFATALRAALASLTLRERTVLRLHVVEDISADALGRMYNVHRSTTTRWIAQAREQVHARVKDELARTLKLGTGDFQSIARVLGDGVDFTLSTFLSEPQESPPATTTTTTTTTAPLPDETPSR